MTALALCVVFSPLPSAAQSSLLAQSSDKARGQTPSVLLADAGSPGTVVQTPRVTAQLLAYAPKGVQVGGLLHLGLRLRHQPGWHTYWKNPGDSGLATTMTWTLPEGLHAQETEWPLPKKIVVAGLTNLGYEDEVLLVTPVQVTKLANTQQPVVISLKATWMVCRTECIPEEGHLAIELPPNGALAQHAADFEAARERLPQRFNTVASVTLSPPVPTPPVQDVLPSAGRSAAPDMQPQMLTLHVERLPLAWRGKQLTLYAQTPNVVELHAEPSQQWKGSQWVATLPAHSQREESPRALRWVLQITGNNPRNPAVEVVAQVQGEWHPVAAARVHAGLQAAVETDARPAAADTAAASSWLDREFWLAVLGALAGGLILNLMPCVLPVVALKLASLVRQGDTGVGIKATVRVQPRTNEAVISADETLPLRAHSALFSLGIGLGFAGVGLLMLMLRRAGYELGWGFQMQSPEFVLTLVVLFVLIALNLQNNLRFSIPIPHALAGLRFGKPAADALFSGFMVVLVAAPCTAPFMGASLGMAITLPWAQALVVFLTLGFGMALPFVVVALVPGVSRAMLRSLPRAGNWMEVLRQFLAWPVWATVLWLLWVYAQQTSLNAVFAVAGFLLCGVALLWAAQLEHWPIKGAALGAVGAAGLVLGALLRPFWADTAAVEGSRITAPSGVSQVRPVPAAAAGGARASSKIVWSKAAELQVRQDAAVFVNFTAAWCLTCQANDLSTLRRPEIEHAFAQKNVVFMRADWTRFDAQIASELARFGRSGVPVYALYKPGQSAPVLLPEVLSVSAVKQALDAL